MSSSIAAQQEEVIDNFVNFSLLQSDEIGITDQELEKDLGLNFLDPSLFFALMTLSE